MIKSIASVPPPERRYIRRMVHRAGQPSVIGGVVPTGKFPTAVGSGIFGVENRDNGIFDGSSPPNSNTGIFYNDYAKDSWEVQQGDLQWQLLRRPGRPLYPGSSASGIVLIGPSMGTESETPSGSSMTGKLVLGAAAIGAAWWFFSRIKKAAEEM